MRTLKVSTALNWAIECCEWNISYYSAEEEKSICRLWQRRLKMVKRLREEELIQERVARKLVKHALMKGK